MNQIEKKILSTLYVTQITGENPIEKILENDMISEERLKKQNIFDPAPVLKVWKTHENGRDSHPDMIWGFLMLQSWLDKNK